MPRKKRVNKLFTLDTETYGLGGELKRIAVYDGKRVHYGYKYAEDRGRSVRGEGIFCGGNTLRSA